MVTLAAREDQTESISGAVVNTQLASEPKSGKQGLEIPGSHQSVTVTTRRRRDTAADVVARANEKSRMT